MFLSLIDLMGFHDTWYLTRDELNLTGLVWILYKRFPILIWILSTSIYAIDTKEKNNFISF